MLFPTLYPFDKYHDGATDQRVFQDGKINEHLRRKVRPRRGEHAGDVVVGRRHILSPEDDPAYDHQEKRDGHLSTLLRGWEERVRCYDRRLPLDT